MTTKIVQSLPTQLYEPISSSVTTFKIKTPYDIYGNKLTMAALGSIAYGTFEPKSRSNQEIFSFTGLTDNGDGTTDVTGAVRGLKASSGYAAGGTARSHGSSVTIILCSDHPQLFDKLAFKDNDENITGLYTYTQFPKKSGSLVPTSNDEFVPKAYADGLSFAGAPDGSYTQKGIYERSTTSEINDDASAGSTTAPLAITAADLKTSKYAEKILVQAQSTPGLTVAVKAFRHIALDFSTSYGGGSTSALTAPTVNPRIDLVVITSGGTLALRTGAEAASPVMPTPTNGDVVIAALYLRVGTTAIYNEDKTTNGYIVNMTPVVYRNDLALTSQAGQQRTTLVAGAAITAGQALHITPYYQNGGAVLYDNYSGTNYNNVTNQSKTFVVGSNSNRLLLVKIVTNAVPTSVAYNGSAMTLVTSQAIDGTYTMYLYKLVAPSTGSNSILVTSTGIYQISASSYYNVDPTTNVEAFAKSNTGNPTITQGITTLSPGALVFGTYSTVGGTDTGTPGTGSGQSDAKYVSSYALNNIHYFFDTTGAIRADVTADSGVLNETQGRNIGLQYGNTSTGPSACAAILVSLKPANAFSLGVVPATTNTIVQNEPLIDFIGFAESSVSEGASVSVLIAPIITGLSGLTTGKKYFLQNTAGTIGTVRSNAYGKLVGVALSTSSLLISPDKTVGGPISKIANYTYTAECDGFAQLRGNNTLIIDGVTFTGVANATMTIPVTRGKTYIASAGAADTYFTPLA